MWGDDDDKLPLPMDAMRLVAIDLDGTLFRSDGNVSKETARAINEARKAGVKIVLCSARPPRGVMEVYNALGLDTIMVNHNGALIYDPAKEKPIYHAPLETAVAKKIVVVAMRTDPSVTLGVEHINDICGFKWKRKPGETAPRLPAKMVKLLEGPAITKVMIIGQPDRLSDIEGQLVERFQGKVDFAFSNLNLMQVVRKGVDKSTALEAVAKHYKVPQKLVMAIGDAPNDLGMIKWAGMGVSMGNGWEVVRKAARMVVPSNDDDGVAYALRKYALM